MSNVFDLLLERGFIEQATHYDEIKHLLNKEKVTFYIGFDPTSDSLTAGHYMQLVVMSHMQKAGHKPIVLIGGGTALIGDPTGKTDMRKMLTKEQIKKNVESIKEQVSKFIDFSDDKAILVDNSDWLLNLNYVDFIRTIGVNFSVNRMLSAECYKSRMEKGLTFLEFNYMIMQSYDFLELFNKYDCNLQLGGNDQWSNILGGVELIRKKESKSAFGMTFGLLTTSEGKKMGKTESGAIWLDPEKTSPYDFYQYWRNTEDVSVKKCLSLLTFLPFDEVEKLGELEGSELNKAKEVLAYELTKTVHGIEEANKAQEAAKSLFGGGSSLKNVPSSELPKSEFERGMDILTLLSKANLIPSRSEGRRLVTQGGVKVNSVKVESIDFSISLKDFDEDNSIIIQKGKKVFHMVKLLTNS